MIWILVGYMWLFVHRPFEVWPSLAPLHIERVYMLATLGYWIVSTKVWTANRVNWAIGLLATVMVAASLLSPYIDFLNRDLEDWLKILVFYVLVMSSVREERELCILIVALVVVMGLYELHSLREYRCGRHDYRMGTTRMIGVDQSLGDPNSFAASVNYVIPMLWPVFALAKRKWHYLGILGLLVLAVVCILLTGSRTGFTGLAGLTVGATLGSRFRWKMLVPLLVGLPLVWFCLNDDLRERYRTLVDPDAKQGAGSYSAESRKIFFWMSVDIWKEHPVLGVGPGCFKIASRTGMYAHTLYGETISELGTAGAFAVITLIGCYLLNFVEGRRLYRAIALPHDAAFSYRVLLATTITVLQLMFFGLGGHNLFRFTWLWYGAFSALALKFLYVRYHEAIGCTHPEMDEAVFAAGENLAATVGMRSWS